MTLSQSIEKILAEFRERFPNNTKIIRINLDSAPDGTPENWHDVDMGLHLDIVRYRQLNDFLLQSLTQIAKESIGAVEVEHKDCNHMCDNCDECYKHTIDTAIAESKQKAEKYLQ